jgi:phospholipid/cholesterol/gamma-HCH transport system substrate-binding protein
MNALGSSRPRARLLTLAGFLVVFLGGLMYFWTQTGGEAPGFGDSTYRITFRTADLKNLQQHGDVQISGVVVGYVASKQVQDGQAQVALDLNQEVAPLHDGATVRVGVKSVIGSSYVDIIDGHGRSIPSDSVLPNSAVRPAVDIDDVIGTFDPKTRTALSGSMRSLGAATTDTASDSDRLLKGFGMLGRQGHTALDAVAAQSQQLTALTRESGKLLASLDTGRGQIADVVRDAGTLTKATAGQREALASTMRQMPEFLGSARTATNKVGELSGALNPVVTDLNRAAPDLSQALTQLPSVTGDLRGLLPPLNTVLDRAPTTLDRAPSFSSDISGLVPNLHSVLRDVNPMLRYLKPYGRDIGAMTANFGGSMDVVAEDGVRPIRLAPIFNTGSVRGVPFPLSLDPTHWNNPYPKPGQAGNPAPFTGAYPRVERDPN